MVDESKEVEVSELATLRRELLKLRQENAILGGGTQVLVEGVLLRFREQVLSASWKKRFFDLRVSAEGAVLRCFEYRGGHDHSCRGVTRMTLKLSKHVEVVREADVRGKKPGDPLHSFHLKLPPGTGPTQLLRFGANTEDEVCKWVEAIKAGCQGPSERAEDPAPLAQTKVEKSSEIPALRAVHTKIRPSVLTADEECGGVPDCNVVGVLNLSVTVMVIIHLRLIYENIAKHGIVLDTFRLAGGVATNPAHLQCLLCFCGLPAAALFSLGVEIAASRGTLHDLAASSAHGAICTLVLAIPSAVIRDAAASPPVGGMLLLTATILFLKLVSFAHVNWALRQQVGSANREADDESKVHPGSRYPGNLNTKDFGLFLVFPTLVYQTTYPRTSRIRKKWLAKRLLELLLVMAMSSVIAEQFVGPTLKKAALPVLSLDIPNIILAVLKISVPNVYLWLFMFYGLFHLGLNIVAELTFFGDRLFYKEWWNATKLEDYWRLWNLPVHNWLVKHIFLPILNSGYTKSSAVVATFFVSAVFHELLVSIPCHTMRLWAFFGMMAQLPLVHLTAAIDHRLKGSQIGNVIFWISFCIVGQPLCVLLYFAAAR